MYGNQTAGLVAAAVLGIGTANTSEPVTVKTAAAQVGQQLAATGASLSVSLAVVAMLLILGGVLLVGLARRHGVA